MLSSKGFDLWADNYDRTVHLSDEDNSYPFAGYKQVLARIYETIRAGEGSRVLDIGFGTAVLAAKLYQDGYAITGIDFSEKMIAIAAEKMPAATLIHHDFSTGLPNALENEQFDFIVCTYAIHHLTDQAKIRFIADLQRHLAPGGQILIGDVAFPSRQDLEACKTRSGNDWDDDEFYIVADELSAAFPGLRFDQLSHCAGVVQIGAGNEAAHKPTGIFIFGPSGSGKTTLGRVVAQQLGYPYVDIDDCIWRKDTAIPFTALYPRQERIRRVTEGISQGEHFVLAGSMDSFYQHFAGNITLAVLLLADTDLRAQRVDQRAHTRFGARVLPGGDMFEAHQRFLADVRSYESGGGPTSLATHRQIGESLPCPLMILDGAEAPEFNARKVLEAYKQI